MDKMDASLKCQENELSELRRQYVESCAEAAYWKTMYTTLQEEQEKEAKARSLLTPQTKTPEPAPNLKETSPCIRQKYGTCDCGKCERSHLERTCWRCDNPNCDCVKCLD